MRKLVRQKGMSPFEAKRRTTVEVLKLFEMKLKETDKDHLESTTLTWDQLWRKAKENEIGYETLKRVVARLTKSGILRASVNYELEREFTLVAPLPKVVYLSEVIGFLQKQLEKWNLPLSFGRMCLFSELSSSDLKELVSHKDQAKLWEAQVVLHKIREKIALNKFSEEDKRQILQYEEKARTLVDLIHKSQDKIALRKLVEATSSPEQVTHKMRSWSKHLKGFDTEFVILDPRHIDALVSKCGSKTEEIETLTRWLKENRKLYDEFLERQKEQPKLLLTISSGFDGYMRESSRLARMFPVEWVLSEEQKRNPEFKKKVKNIVERFGDKSTIYLCGECDSFFRKKSKAENHVKKLHTGRDVKPSVQEIDTNYYCDLLGSLHSSHF